MTKATYKKVSGVWKQVHTIWIKVSGSWQPMVVSFMHASGVWKQCMDTPPASSFIVDAGGFTVDNAICTYSTGVVAFDGATCGYNITSLTVQVTVTHYIAGLKSTTNYYTGAYNTPDDLGPMTHVVYGPPIPDKGYTVRLEFLESA